jgi:hypothetical protein
LFLFLVWKRANRPLAFDHALSFSQISAPPQK